MNKEAFLKSLKRHAKKYNWMIDRFGNLRTTGSYSFCPITMLHYERNGNYIEASFANLVATKKFNMTNDLAMEIITAADNCDVSNPRLRNRLIKIVGLKD